MRSRHALLESSPFVYISPLRADGSESTCHGEVWFGWLDGAVLINTAPTTWKSRALAAGRDRARIWVGDHGRVKQMIGSNEAFRSAPHFDARVESVKGGEALLDRLLALYAEEVSARDRQLARQDARRVQERRSAAAALHAGVTTPSW